MIFNFIIIIHVSPINPYKNTVYATPTSVFVIFIKYIITPGKVIFSLTI